MNNATTEICLAGSPSAADTCRANAEEELVVMEAIPAVDSCGETEVDFIAVVSDN